MRIRMRYIPRSNTMECTYYIVLFCSIVFGGFPYRFVEDL